MGDNLNQGLTDFEQVIQAKTRELSDLVNEGDIGHALDVVEDILKERDKSLFAEVGKLTRSLHDAIRNFHVDVDSEKVSAEDVKGLSEMTDATDRLTYVVEMTEKSANKTMDIIDESMPVARELGDLSDDLRDEWKRLSTREMSAQEFRDLYWRMDEFLGRISKDASILNGNFSEILLAQDFQDLTGQVIQKVTGLVKDVEGSLVNLMVMASKVDDLTGQNYEKAEIIADITKGHGPQIDKKKEDVVESQDDVDDLLSSLGF